MTLRRAAAVAASLGLALLSRPAPAGAEEAAAAPPASIGGVVETVHGYEVRDPFRGLEDRAGADAWIRAQNARTEAWWDAHPDAAFDARLEELYALDRIWDPAVEGKTVFFLRQPGDRQQESLRALVDGVERTLVDPDALDPTGRTALDWYYPSEDGSLVAYGLSKDGTEDSVLRVLETATGKDRGVEIPDTRWCSVAWLPDATGFYYTRYPAGERYGPRVHLHRLGGDPAKDPVVFGEGLDPTWFPGAVVAEDGKHVALVTDKGWSSTDVAIEDRATGARTTVFEGKDGEHAAVVRVADGQVWAVSNVGAPRSKLVRFSPEPVLPAEGTRSLRFRAEDVVGEREWTLEGARYAGGSWLLHYLDAAASRLVVVGPDGAVRDVALPEPLLELGGLAADERGGRFVFTYSSFSTPSALVEGDAAAATARALVRVDAGSKAALRVERVRYPSTDGAWVPMRVVRPDGEGPRGPTLLTGYGGFNVSLGPGFDVRALAWVERGGTFAEPNLRGGGELGEAWHRAGSRENKPQVFDDFEQAMRFLVARGTCTTRTLAITGGSNGGLLVGAMAVRCPELFAAAVGDVGLYDMVRYHLWPPADIWSDEYGSSEDPTQAGFLLGYSPYHQVRPGVAFPAFLGRTAEQDERVSWRHTAKFLAALQHANAGDRPALFHMETKVGHGQGKPRSERIRDASRLLRFLWANAGGAPAGT